MNKRIGVADYERYMRGHHWRKRRELIIKRDGGKCRTCGTTKALNVHHVTYHRLGYEHPDDLITLCKPCHQAVHCLGGCHDYNRSLAVSLDRRDPSLQHIEELSDPDHIEEKTAALNRERDA